MKEEIQNLLESFYNERIQIKDSFSTGGGSINQTQVLTLTNGQKAFLKHHSNPPQKFFECEAQGLKILSQASDGPKTPKVLGLQKSPNPKFLILEYIEEGSTRDGFYIKFAQALAEMHRVTHETHGLDHDNFIGKTPQKNSMEKDGLVFFREHRLRFQQELARKSGLLPSSVDQDLDKFLDKLENLLDLTGEKPALLHGDLWSGNYLSGPGKTPYIFDPAVYFGLRETDLAMTELFGRLPDVFYETYHEAFPMNPGYSGRKMVYNLYHLLNHLNLFGSSYLSSVEATVRHFVR